MAAVAIAFAAGLLAGWWLFSPSASTPVPDALADHGDAGVGAGIPARPGGLSLTSQSLRGPEALPAPPRPRASPAVAGPAAADPGGPDVPSGSSPGPGGAVPGPRAVGPVEPVEPVEPTAPTSDGLPAQCPQCPPLPALVGGEARLGYLDVQKVLAETNEGRAAKAKLKKEFDAEQRRLDVLQAALKQDRAALEELKRAGSVPPDDLRAQEAALETRASDITKTWRDAQAKLAEEEKRATALVLAKVNAAAREVAEADGYLFIFDKNECGLLFAPVALDLTGEVVRRLNSHPMK